jgi:hypothetical protein
MHLLWQRCSTLVESTRRMLDDKAVRFQLLKRAWDERLAPLALGGDPSSRSWTDFYPLRLGGREAWADWMATLLLDSRTGGLAWRLFGAGKRAPDLALPSQIQRASEPGRLDLLIEWRSAALGHTHLEVRVTDEGLETAFETHSRMQRDRPGKWSQVLLLPPGAEGQWLAVRGKRTQVKVVDWRAGAIALRRSLRNDEEPGAWKALAHVLLGAIEQRVLGHPPAALQPKSLVQLDRRVAQMELMEEALRDG